MYKAVDLPVFVLSSVSSDVTAMTAEAETAEAEILLWIVRPKI
jgi:hypothetical protein